MGAALLRVAEGPGCRLFAGRGDERRGLLPGYVPVGRPERGEGARVEAYALETSAGSFRGSRDRFESVVSWLDGEEAADLTHAELEARLQVDGRELLRQLLQDHQDLRAERETRPAAVIGAGGVARGSAEAGRERKLATVLGDVQVRRVAYRARGHADLHPADGALNLPDEQYSHGLRRLAAIESARGSFAESAASVEQITGQRLGNRQVEQLAQRAAVDFDRFYASGRDTCARPVRCWCSPATARASSCDPRRCGRPRPRRRATPPASWPPASPKGRNATANGWQRSAPSTTPPRSRAPPATSCPLPTRHPHPGRKPVASGWSPASPTTRPRSSGRSSTKRPAATPASTGPGSRWSTATPTRSSASRRRREPAASTSPSWSTSSMSLSICGAPPGASSLRAIPTPRRGSATTRCASSTDAPAMWRARSAARQPARALRPANAATPTPPPPT